jgi:hypothetical protein
MTPGIYAFSAFALIGVFFLIMGIRCRHSDKPSGFWANAEQFEVNDVRAYNKAMSKLWFAAAVLYTAIGLPLLTPANILLVILVSMVGCMIVSTGLMVYFTTVIEPKSKKK